MKLASLLTLAFLTVITPFAFATAGAADPIVTRRGSRLFINETEYRAIGVNIPNLHQLYFGTWFHLKQFYQTPEQAREAAVAALDDAQRSGLAFVRFFAYPFYPREVALEYDQNPDRYWQQMDELIALCRQRQLKLIPCLGTIPGPYLHMGESGRAILDPQSKTHQWVQQYVRQFVTRYKDDPTILMWELVNEGMLNADIEMAGRPLLPKGVYPPGTSSVRETGTLEDSLRWHDYHQLYRDQTAFIKSLDPQHLVTSGDAGVRPECTSRRETFPDFRFRTDTWREWLANNLASQPDPLDVLSFHTYGNTTPETSDVPWKGMSTIDQMQRVVRCVQAADAPVLIGELGKSPTNASDPTGRWLCEFIDAMETENVSLMALWVWHFPHQPDMNMTGDTYPQVVQRAAEFNRRHAATSQPPVAADTAVPVPATVDVGYIHAPQDDAVAAQIRQDAQEGIARIEKFFAQPFPKRFDVEIFPSRADFDRYAQKRWQAPKTEKWMVASGVSDRLTVLSPRVWKTEAVEHDPDDAVHMRELIAHELVHVYHGQHNPRPDFDGMDECGWFVEGLAVYASGQLDGPHRSGAREAIAANKSPSKLADAWSGRYRYGVSGSLVEYLDKRYGLAVITQLLASESNADILTKLGTTETALLDAWREWVARPPEQSK